MKTNKKNLRGEDNRLPYMRSMTTMWLCVGVLKDSIVRDYISFRREILLNFKI